MNLIDFESQLEQERNERVARRIAKHDEILRECVKRKLDQIDASVKEAERYCNELFRSGADITDEIKELTEMGLGMQLVAGILQMQAAKIPEAAE